MSDGKDILEDQVQLMHDGQDRLATCYVHYAKQSTFHCRTYGEDKTNNLLLVHYLDTFIVYKVSADH
eukprot:3345034-Ditylum_brightwellii.AAC.1